MKRFAPAADRNKQAILEALRARLSEPAHVIEIASGSGQHAVHLARHLPHLRWQPSDVDAAAVASVAAYRDEAGLDNLAAPLRLDVTEPDWGEPCDAIFCANMIHIAPWPAVEGLFAGARRRLSAGGQLLLYGPFLFDDVEEASPHHRANAASNVAFGESLRTRDPRWGVRSLGSLATLGAPDLVLEEVVDLPTNNFLCCWRRR